MDDVHKKALRKRQEFLEDTLRVDLMRDRILQDELLSEREMQVVMAETVPFRRVAAFIDAVVANGRSWDSLLFCLEREFSHAKTELETVERRLRSEQSKKMAASIRSPKKEANIVHPGIRDFDLTDDEKAHFDKMLNDNDIWEIAVKIGAKHWEAIGQCVFGYDSAELEHLEADNPKNSKTRNFKMVQMWTQKNPELNTRKCIILGFYDNNYMDKLSSMEILFGNYVAKEHYKEFCEYLKTI